MLLGFLTMFHKKDTFDELVIEQKQFQIGVECFVVALVVSFCLQNANILFLDHVLKRF